MSAVANRLVNLDADLDLLAPNLFFEGFHNLVLCAKATVYALLRKYPAVAARSTPRSSPRTTSGHL